MTVHNLSASTSDNGVESTSTTYSTARAGTGTKTLLDASDTFQSAGQEKGGSTFFVFEQLESYDTSTVPASGAAVVSAYFSKETDSSASSSWLLVAREKDFGSTVDTGDFVAGASLGTLPFLAQAQMSTALPQPRIYAGSTELVTRLGSVGPVRALWHSDRQRLGQAPTGTEDAAWWTGDKAGQEPRLTVLTAPSAGLLYHSAAMVQLSDGDTAYLQADPTLVALKLVTTSTVADIDAIAVGPAFGQYALPAGLQSLALVRDASDNLYLIGAHGQAPDTQVLVTCYAKGTGNSWTQRAQIAYSIPAYTKGTINNLAAAWHPTAGDGHIMVVVSHNAGAGKTGQVGYTIAVCESLLADTDGTQTLESGSDPTWLGISSQAGPAPYTNETGSSLDIAASGNVGVVYTIDDPNKTIAGKYTLGTDGHVLAASSGPFTTSDAVTIAHDADAKVRVIPLDASRVAFAAAGTITVRTYAGVILGQADLTTQGLNTFPSADTLRGTAAWDVVYDPASNKIWHYYVDITGTTKIKRTGFSLATYQGSGEETAVHTHTSAVVALAAPRGTTDERRVEVRLPGGATFTDSLNVAPNAPTLTPKTTFDATKAAVFGWTFADANPLDTQSAYQLVINNASGASAYDSGKVTSATSNHTLPASSLANDKSWQWKVRTWDTAGASGTYSAVAAFSTTSAGTVAITAPATDNATLKSASVQVAWSVTGATQAQYRIKVVATSTGTTLSDTGFVVSTATTATVTGLTSGVEYRLEVTVKDVNGILSSTGTRLVTPSYTSPEAPVITAVDSGDGYILVTITNPPPQGDEPEISRNDVYRRKAADTMFERIATVERNGSYKDYTAASGQSYVYKVTGVV
ncbi:MAG TPA: fibronectin type III domain-containing protein [Mycobacteriales bacterium]